MVKGVIDTVKKHPKLSALGGLAATAGPIPAALAAGGYAAYKNRDKIKSQIKKELTLKQIRKRLSGPQHTKFPALPDYKRPPESYRKVRVVKE